MIAHLLFVVAATLQPAPLDRVPVVRAPLAPPVSEALANADTTTAVRLLEQQVASSRNDATSWFFYGLLSWQQAQGVRSAGFIRDQQAIRNLRVADSALRLAAQLAPENAEFAATLARFNRQAATTSQRLEGQQLTSRALRLARESGDSALIAWGEAEQGIDAWRRFSSVRNRAHTTSGQRLQVQTNMRWNRARGRSYVNSMVKRLTPPTGRDDFEAAFSRFLIAERSMPTSVRYSRLVYMALAETGRWEELLQRATRRAAAFPMDGQARFARGLALQRLSRTAEARAAFDTARATLDEMDDARLFGIHRLLPPEEDDIASLESARILALPPAERLATTRVFWATKDPLSDSTSNSAEVEFIARVVEAEFRFTDDALAVNGADTDRGAVLVRYGPPDEILTLAGPATSGQDDQSRPTTSMSGQELRDVSQFNDALSRTEFLGSTIVWLYDLGVAFFFDFRPGFGSAHVPQPDSRYVRDVARSRPMSFANVDGAREVDGLTAQVARFRGADGRVDVVTAASIAGDSLVASAGDSIRYVVRMLDGAGVEQARSRDVLPSTRPVTAARVVAQSPQIVLIDARRESGEGNVVADRRARAALALPPGPTLRGPSMSDLLLTSAAPTSTARDPRDGWQALAPLALAGRLPARARVGLAWELYNLGVDSTQAPSNRYRITIAVESVTGGGSRAFAVRVLDAVGRVLGQSGARDQRAVQFERRMPATDRVLEHFTLDGIDVDRGRVHIRVEVEDLVRGQRYTREQVLVVEPR